MSVRIAYIGVALALIASLALPFAANAAVDENGKELKMGDYISKPQKELQARALENDTKGKALYAQGKYAESIAWFDRSSFFSTVLIEQAKQNKAAKEREDAALKAAKEREEAALKAAKEREDADRKAALARLEAARNEVKSAGNRAN